MQNFINHGTITTTSKYSLDTTNTGTGGFGHIYNYGHISGYVYIAGGESSATYIHNYGTMGGAIKASNGSNQSIYVNNYGTINLCETNGSNGCTKKAHFKNVNLVLQDYAMRINVDSATFNAFDGNATDNSHLVLDSVTSVKFADSARLILEFGSGFEFGKGYLFNKLVVDTSGNNALGVDFDRLMPQSDIYTLIQSGEYLIAKLTPQHSAISNISKANIRTMNNFYTLSNSMIYPRKLYHSQNLGNPSLRDLPTANRGNPQESLDSAISLKSYESFSYRNESVNRRIQRQNKRNYNKRLPTQSNSQNLKENQRNLQNLNTSQTQTFSQNLAQNPNYSQTPHNYYFILTPFFNYNSFAKSGNYNLSGFDYGFLTAFSTKVAESNHLEAQIKVIKNSVIFLCDISAVE